MNGCEYINGRYESFVNEQAKTKDKYKRIAENINRCKVGGIVLSGGVFWIEAGSGTVNYVYNDIVKWGKEQGYKFLYDLKEGDKTCS
jgi:hypothetical protein